MEEAKNWRKVDMKDAKLEKDKFPFASDNPNNKVQILLSPILCQGKTLLHFKYLEEL